MLDSLLGSWTHLLDLWMLFPLFGLFGGKGVLGGLFDSVYGGKSGAEKNLEKLARASYTSSDIQRYLPPALRDMFTGPLLTSGVAGIGELLKNPGGLSPGVADAIRPRLAMESQNIGQQYRNIQSNTAGALARGNAPVSIKGALQAALDTQQERSQREARGAALTESEQLRRGDLSNLYNLLNIINEFISSGRGQGLQALSSGGQIAAERTGANRQHGSDIFSTLMGGAGGGIM